MKKIAALIALLLVAPPVYGATPLFQVNDTSSAVNNVEVTGAASGSAPTVTSSGTDPNVGLTLNTQGSGALSLQTTSSGNVILAPGVGGNVAVPAFTTAGIVQNNASGILSSTTTLPNGITATTQPALDNSTKVATTAYVDSATGGASGIKSITVQKFTSSGTYTPNANLVYAIVKMVGGGGGSGASTSGGSGGGGAGGYLEALLTAAQIGASQSVTIGSAGSAGSSGSGGSGGTTSLGSLLSCDGGDGGAPGTATSAAGGTGGAASVLTGTAIIEMTGQTGGYGAEDFLVVGGDGGSTPLGYGGAMTVASHGNAVSGLTGVGYGSGGGGACESNSGAAGQAGYIEITEFNSQ